MSQSAKGVIERLKKHILADGFPIVFDFEKSHDVYLTNAYDEREYLDCFSFFASLPIGYNHPKLKDPEYQKKLMRTAQVKIANPDVYTVEYADFVETFARVLGGKHFSHYFFIDGGALAVENALKVAFDWKVRKNLRSGKGERGHKVIYFENAFHGRSGYTLTLTNTFDPNKTKYFPKFDWFRVPAPYIRERATEADSDREEKIVINQIKDIIREHETDLACMIIEPIQAEGGDNHFRKKFLQELRALCDENDILLIFDEVQTGIGLTGKMWAHEHFDVIPDVLSFGKKTQVCGIMATSRIDDEDNAFKVSSRINSTFGGNLIDMVRCERYLQIIESDKLCDNAAQVGTYLMDQLRSLQKSFPTISHVRGRGLFVAFDLPDTTTRNRFREEVWKNGGLVLNSGPRSVRLRPSLVFSKQAADHAVEIFGKALKGVLK